MTTPKNALKIAIIALTALVTFLYVIPDAIVAIYTTTLGTATALLVGIYLFFYKDWRIAVAYIAISILLWRIIGAASTSKEGFESTTAPTQWPSALIRQFTQFQATVNPQHIFDTSQIQKYATPQEADYFMKNQEWEWDEPTETLYRAALAKNPMIADAPDNSVNHARRLYSQGQIRQILFMQSPEGRALIDGIVLTPPPEDPANPLTRLKHDGKGTFAYTSGLTNTATTQPLLQCDPATAQPVIVQPYGAKIDTGDSVGLLAHGARALWPKETIPITDMADLRKYGFKFPDGQPPCNPCKALLLEWQRPGLGDAPLRASLRSLAPNVSGLKPASHSERRTAGVLDPPANSDTCTFTIDTGPSAFTSLENII